MEHGPFIFALAMMAATFSWIAITLWRQFGEEFFDALRKYRPPAL